MPQPVRSKNVCFTINNYTPEQLAKVKALQDTHGDKINYIVFQEEIGKQGTPHLQGFTQLTKLLGVRQLRGLFGGGHFTSANGTIEQNRTYCTKDDTRRDGTSPYEYGTPRQSEKGRRNDLELAAKAFMQRDRGIANLVCEFPKQYVMYNRGLLSIRQVSIPERNFKTDIYWFSGPTGSGKSRLAYELFPSPTSYTKPPTNKWWDSYSGQYAVIIDDYRPDFCTFAELLRLFDRYPLWIESKGGGTNFCSQVIIITCPKQPAATWCNRTEEDLAQLSRRITGCYTFPEQEEQARTDVTSTHGTRLQNLRHSDTNVERHESTTGRDGTGRQDQGLGLLATPTIQETLLRANDSESDDSLGEDDLSEEEN